MNINSKSISKKISVYTTSDYGMFENVPGNRCVSLVGDIRKSQMKSLMNNGWFNHEPAKCVLHNGKMYIIDGQHRIEMAKRLKIDVCFIVLDTTYEKALELMVELQSGKSWSIIDYCNKYGIDNDNYKYAISFAQKNGISINQSLALNAGELAATGNIADKIKSGRYVTNNKEYANKVIDIRNAFSGIKKISNTTALLKACAKLAHVKEFSLDQLKNKLNTFSYLIENQGSVDGFIQMIELIYNYHNNMKIPLFFIVKETMARRSVAQPLKKA